MFQIEYKITHPVWYAMKASYGKSIKAKELLDLMAVENYVPMCHKEVVVKRRKKIVLVPAVSGIIFIKADLTKLKEAKQSIHFLHNMLTKSSENNEILKPIIVPDKEMEQFMKIVNTQREIKYLDMTTNPLVKGAKVRVIDGEFKGYEGILMKIKGSRAKKVVINISGLVAIEMDAINAEMIEKIK